MEDILEEEEMEVVVEEGEVEDPIKVLVITIEMLQDIKMMDMAMVMAVVVAMLMIMDTHQRNHSVSDCLIFTLTFVIYFI